MNETTCGCTPLSNETATTTTPDGDVTGGKTAETTVYRAAMDLHEFDDRFEAHLDVPGARPEDVRLTVHEDELLVEAPVAVRMPEGATPLLVEDAPGDFRRRLRLGTDVDQERIDARHEDGTLVIVLPKRAERRPRRIEIRRG